MTPKFDQYVNSILLKESPDNVTYDSEYHSYYKGEYTGLIPSTNKSVFLLYDDSAIPQRLRDEGEDSPGHGSFTSRLRRTSDESLKDLAKNMKTNGNLKEFVGRHGDHITYLKFRIWKNLDIISYWGFPLKEEFNATLESIKSLGRDPSQMLYDFNVDGRGIPTGFEEAQKIQKKEYDTVLYDFETTNRIINGVSEEEEAKHKEEAERKRREQAELEKQVKLRALGFSGPTKKPWQI